jgi:hypothetical protein
VDNPYHHPEQKKHVVNSDDVRRLAFEAFNIVRASMGMMGQGLVEEVEEGEEGEGAVQTSIEDLHYQLAEQELSSKLLRIAMLMRTLDDYWSDLGHDSYVEAINKVNKDNDVGLFWVDDEPTSFTFREALNKIIHAQDVRPVYDTDDDSTDTHARWGMDGHLELRGTQGKHEWAVTLYLDPFF